MATCAPPDCIYSDRNKKPARHVWCGSQQLCLFDCTTCGHTYEQMALKKAKRGSGCPYCVKQTPPCDDPECNYCYSHSVAKWMDESAPPHTTYHSSNTLPARKVWTGSKRKCVFGCSICGHVYHQRVKRRVREGVGCPYCAKQADPCDDPDCAYCFKHTLAEWEAVRAGPLGASYHANNEKPARKVWAGSPKVCLFSCSVCKHTYPQRVSKKTGVDEASGAGCPYCAPVSDRLCDDHDCSFCLNRRAASLLKDFEARRIIWLDKTVDPYKVTRSSRKRVRLGCGKCGHEWSPRLYNVTRDQGCPKCKHKTQAMVHDFILSLLPDHTVEHEWSPPWLNKRRFDIAVPELKIIWEVDGDQHYIQISNWTPPEITQATDRWKESRAAENGFIVHRIRVRDIRAKGSRWKEIIAETVANALGRANTPEPRVDVA